MSKRDFIIFHFFPSADGAALPLRVEEEESVCFDKEVFLVN